MYKVFICVLLLTSRLSWAQSQSIDVLPVSSIDAPLTFDYGKKCVLRAKFSDTVQIRIFRGSVADLVALSRNSHAAGRACMHLPSLVVTPARWRDLLNLRFYFNPDWLDADGSRDATFLFVFEKSAPAPLGAPISKSETIDLPVSEAGAQYFESGIQVTVRAPTFGVREVAHGAHSGHHTSGQVASTTVGGDNISVGDERPLPGITPPKCDAATITITATNTNVSTAEVTPRKAEKWVSVRP
jgi:hypothetical protein